jgi:hypothetical protein
MLEQQLINTFMKFTARAGAGDIIRDLIQKIEDNGNPKSWTPQEMESAIDYLEHRVSTFSKDDALNVIRSLTRKYYISPADLANERSRALPTPGRLDPDTRPDESIGHELPGVKGLQ